MSRDPTAQSLAGTGRRQQLLCQRDSEDPALGTDSFSVNKDLLYQPEIQRPSG